MRKTTRKLVNGLLAACLAASIGIQPVLAQIANPDSAITAATTWTGDWQSLAAGEERWYQFQYAGNQQAIQVWLDVAPAQGVEFEIWTAEMLQRLRAGEVLGPLAVGTAMEGAPARHFWQGSSPTADTYYVIVRATAPERAQYLLHVGGPGLVIATMDIAATAPAADVPTLPQMVGAEGIDDFRAFLAQAENWYSLAPGQVAWHDFRYTGNMQLVYVWMDVAPLGGARFDVYGPGEQIVGSVTYQDVLAAGISPASPAAPGFMFWRGAFAQPNDYRVRVENTTPGAISYVLYVGGPGKVEPGPQEVIAVGPALAPAVMEPAAAPEPVPAVVAPAAVPEPAPAIVAPAAPTVAEPTAVVAGPATWRTLAPGEVAWHQFNYTGNLQPFQVRMDTSPLGGARFDVYGPATQRFGGVTYQDVLAVGHSNPHPDFPGYLVWTGSFTQAGLYNVRVENTTPGNISYTLTVGGSGVAGN